jgi:hypothetical protein
MKVFAIVKPDMAADFDENDTNSHFAWTSFNIQYAEVWDGSPEPIFTEDKLNNCTPFAGFSNESFDSGLTDWQVTPEQIPWTTGTPKHRVKSKCTLSNTSRF